MKQLRLLLITLTAMLTLLSANAETVYDYTADFNSSIPTGSHDFKVASNWKHIVDKYNDGYGDYWMSYDYKSTGGHSGGMLLAYNQRAGDNYDNKEVYDLLVTPVVCGEISLWVKLYNSSGYVEFYSLNETATSRDTRLARFASSTTPALSQSEWVKVSLTVDDPQRIGIRAAYAYIDDFYAEEAIIEAEKSMTIASAIPSDTSGTLYWSQQADGSVVVKYTVTVTNNGEAKILKGDKGFSVSIINGNTSAVYGTVAVPQDLEIGETSAPFDVIATIAKDDITSVWPSSYSYVRMNLRENLQGTTLARTQSGYKPYQSKFVFRLAGSTSKSSLSGALSFGISSEESVKGLEILNDGTAPLEIISISLPAGFTANLPEAGHVIEGETTLPLTIKLPASNPGSFSGDLKIVYKGHDGKETTYTLPLSGHIITPSTWVADFNNDQGSTPVWPAGSIAESGISTDYSYDNGLYNIYLKSSPGSSYATANNMFITPLLHAQAGETLSFDARREKSDAASFLKVYVSTDRINWGEPKLSYSCANDLTSSFVAKSLTFDTEGDYYVAFSIYGAYVDNIVGLEKKPVTHDIYLTEFSQPEDIQANTEVKATVKFVPLTDERASAYQVIYYVDNRLKATATSVKLTANAKGQESFDITFTPTVTETTTFDTRFDIAFTDGTTFSTETKKLLVVYEPGFVFFDKGSAGSGSIKPADRKAAIAFGVTNNIGLFKEFEIFNWGQAPLEVKSVTVPDGFSVNINSPVTIAGKERQEVIVTFSATEPGNYDGNLTVTYVDADGSDATFTLPVSGKLLDPERWYASFDNGEATGQWPAGSLHEKNVSITYRGSYSEPDCYISSSDSETTTTPGNLFTTPLLHAESGDILEFEACVQSASWSEGKVAVYASATRDGLRSDDRVLLGEFCGNNTDEATKLGTDFSKFSVTMPETGDWYIGFIIYSRARLDNIYGLSPVVNPFDLQIVSSKVPSTAMQNVASVATVDLLNFGIAPVTADSYSVEVTIDGKTTEIPGETDLLPATTLTDTPVQISVPFRSPRTGTATVTITLRHADGQTLNVAEAEVTFAEEVASGEVTVGTFQKFSNSVPLYLNYKNSETVTIYTPELLGLSNGAKISSITLKGYGEIDSYTTDLEVWYDWADSLEKPTDNGAYDTTGMTCALKADGYEWTKKGSSTAATDMITLNFETPLVYEGGKSLRLLVRSYKDGYKNGYYFEQGSETGYSYTHYNDGTAGVLSSSWNACNIPVIHLSLMVEPTSVSGTVTADGAPAAGATVSFVSNDGDGVTYSTVSGADGTYSVNIIQNGRDYDLTATSADGTRARIIEALAFDGEEQLDITLGKRLTLNDATASVESGDDYVIDWETIYPAGFSAIVLPFSLDATEAAAIFGDDALIHEFKGDEGKGAVKANFAVRVTPGLKAGVPYLVYLENPSSRATLHDKQLVAAPRTVSGTRLAFTGTFSPVMIGAGMFPVNDHIFAGSGATRRAPGISDGNLLPFRGYLRSIGTGVNTVTFGTDSDVDIDTGIDAIEEDTSKTTYYDLHGFPVKNPSPGIYILNGKKILVK